MKKDDIRKIIIDARNNLSKKEIHDKSIMIASKLNSLKEYQNAKIVLCYASFKSEVETLGIINDALSSDKIVAIPKVENEGQISFHVIKSINDLSPGFNGIPEPKYNLLDSSLIKDSLIIVPGTVFNKDGYRMGYVKGYYDRFIDKYKPKIKIGIAYDLQISNDIIINNHDQKMDMVITEINIYK